MMESNSILEYFESSVEKRQLRYLTYIDDGDQNGITKMLLQIRTRVIP